MLSDYARYQQALADVELPCAIVDLDTLDHNIAALDHALGTKPVRVATHGLRVPTLIRYITERSQRASGGLATYHPRETAQWAKRGHQDLWLMRPICRPTDAAHLALAARDATVRAIVHQREHIHWLSQAAAGVGTEIRLCLEVDTTSPSITSARPGNQRSDVERPLELARFAASLPHVTLDAVTLTERPQREHAASLAPVRRMAASMIKRQRLSRAHRQVAQVTAALHEDGHQILHVQGHHMANLNSTDHNTSISETTLGTEFLAPHRIGDTRLPLQPALMLALGVTRRLDARHVACSGHPIASAHPGESPRAIACLPADSEVPTASGPFGLELSLEVPHDAGLQIGDPIFYRPASSTEMAEQFSRYHLIRGDKVVEVVPTWRGEGHTFP